MYNALDRIYSTERVGTWWKASASPRACSRSKRPCRHLARYYVLLVIITPAPTLQTMMGGLLDVTYTRVPPHLTAGVLQFPGFPSCDSRYVNNRYVNLRDVCCYSCYSYCCLHYDGIQMFIVMHLSGLFTCSTNRHAWCVCARVIIIKT